MRVRTGVSLSLGRDRGRPLPRRPAKGDDHDSHRNDVCALALAACTDGGRQFEEDKPHSALTDPDASASAIRDAWGDAICEGEKVEWSPVPSEGIEVLGGCRPPSVSNNPVDRTVLLRVYKDPKEIAKEEDLCEDDELRILLRGHRWVSVVRFEATAQKLVDAGAERMCGGKS